MAPIWSGYRVACAWLPLLPLRIDVMRHPAWDGRPLVLGAGPGERQVVRLVSPEAEQAGIRIGQPVRTVTSICPDAIVIQPDPVRLAAVRAEVLLSLQRVSPLVEPADEHFFLDLRGLSTLYRGDLSALERAIRAAMPPLLRPRIGIANGKYTAHVAAALAPTAGFQVIPAAETVAFLAPRPMNYLPFPPPMLNQLELLGLRTVGDLAALPIGAVQAQFGTIGAHAWRLANGLDDERIIPRGVEPAVQAVLRFDDPLASVDAVMIALDRLLITAFANPTMRARSARQARLRALLSDKTSWEKIVTFKEAVSSRDVALRALRGKLELPNGLPLAPIDELALDLLGFRGEAARQGNMFIPQAMQIGRLAEVARHLQARYGSTPLYRAVAVESWSRIPERRWALVPCDL